MMTYRRGAIVIVDFPATSGQPGKRRPSLVIFDAGDADIIIAKLTTRGSRGAFDVVLNDWAAAGLRAPTVVRIDKLLTTEKMLVKQTMGHLSAHDYQIVGKALKLMFGNW